MNLAGAIAYIRNWRESQNLDALTPQEERAAASRLLIEKGYSLPEFIPDATGKLKLIEGVYVSEENTVVVSIESELSVEKTNAENTLPSDAPVFPWQSTDKREFWCEDLQSFVRLTGDVNADGTYYVNKTGDGTFRPWGVKGNKLVPKEQAPSTAPQSEYLLINSAAWADIKNCLINKFIPSYPWSKKGDKLPTEIREEMLNLAKSRKQGLASLIEDERKAGKFEDTRNFVLRMNNVYESFPWQDFAQMLDFK